MGIRVLAFGKTDCHDQFASRSRNDKFLAYFIARRRGRSSSGSTRTVR